MDPTRDNPDQPEKPPADGPDSDFAELDALADKGELTPEMLQDKLHRYSLAMQQEFEIKNSKDPENVEANVKDFFRKNVNAALAQVVWLANYSTADSVRLNASKYVIEKACLESKDAGDPIKDLLKALTKNDPVPVTKNTEE